MPPLAHTSNHHESDSEEDLDYVPEGEEQDSDASEERGAKRPRVQSPQQDDPAAAKSERLALWAKFQDSLNASSLSSSTPPESEPKRMVKIEKRHRFAGEDVVEIVEVPEDSPDAQRWPLWKKLPTDGQDEAADTPKNGDSSSSNAPIPLTDTEAFPTTSSSSPPPVASATTTSATAQPQSRPQTQTTTTSKRPGRRKPKTQLAELPSASDSHKGKKLTTLEKSALDWKAHVHSSSAAELASELEANRRGGGYLEKVEFLQRVGDRKNEALEENRDHKRRRG